MRAWSQSLDNGGKITMVADALAEVSQVLSDPIHLLYLLPTNHF